VRDPFLLDPARVGRLAAALEAASDAFFDVDLATGTIRWSRAVRILFGHDPERLGPHVSAWQRLIHPDDAPAVLESGRAILPSGATVWSSEFRLARADGTYAPVRVRSYVVLEDGRPSHVVGAITDLSELHAIGEDLAGELARTRLQRIRADLLMRSASAEAFGEWDLATGALSWSPNVESVLGHPATDLHDVDALFRHSRQPSGRKVLAELRRAIAAGAESASGRFRFRRGDGGELLLEARGFVVRDEGQRAIKVIGSIGPIAEQRALSRGPAAPVLTERQRQVLALVRRGRTNKEIASTLGVSEQAAKVQVSKLLRKFGVQNRAALVGAAHERGELS
jgi:PAS domain S-box-containing protein